MGGQVTQRMDAVWLVSEGEEQDGVGWIDELVAVSRTLETALAWVAARYGQALTRVGWDVQGGLCPSAVERRVLDLGCLRVVLECWEPIPA